MGTKILTYKNTKDAQRDIDRKAKQGWSVQSVQQGNSNQKVGKSVGIGLATGVLINPLVGIAAGALFGKSKGKVTVVYSVPDAQPQTRQLSPFYWRK